MSRNRQKQLAEEEAVLLLNKANEIIDIVGKAEDDLQLAHKKKRKQSIEQKQRADAAAEEAARKEKQRKREEFERKNPLKPQVGQMVVVAKMQRQGKVVGVKGDDVKVQMGLLTMSVKSHDLRRQ